MVYRCSDALKRGTCKNRLGVREDVIAEAAVTELKRVLSQPDLMRHLCERVEVRIAAMTQDARKNEDKIEPSRP
ncbi:MAG: hypothetical protein M3O36_04780 [Myxococcota bacterium]|nr:hypothetical protein [Myxococcota bacterium]